MLAVRMFVPRANTRRAIAGAFANPGTVND